MSAMSGITADFEWHSLDAWRDFMAGRYPGVEIAAPNAGFRIRYRSWQCGAIEFAEISSVSRLGIRVDVPARNAPDCYYLPLQLGGEFRVGQYGREYRAGPRTLCLLDSHVPHWRELAAGGQLLNVRLPKTMLDRYLVDPTEACERPVAADAGLAAIVWEFANSVWRRYLELGAAMPDMADMLARMAANLFCAPMDAECPDGGADTHRRQLLQCIRDRLGDPQFDVGKAAAACGISPRYVHVLMRDTGRSFSRYLLERRLERCHEALQSKAGRSCSITEIAFRWGFNDMSHFSRVFRTRYGLPPREFRATSGISGDRFLSA
jgi:AraC-like DNA-binding protein